MAEAKSTGSRLDAELCGKIVFVIGCSGCIKHETARHIRAAGPEVIPAARDPSQLQRTAVELGAGQVAASDNSEFVRLEQFYTELPTSIGKALATGQGRYAIRNMIESVPTIAALSIKLFGPIQVLVHGQPMPPLRSRRGLWLLALLTMRANRPVEREWLAGTLWPEIDQSQAFDNLRPLLSGLRAALGSETGRLLSPTRRTLVLDLDGAEADVLTFDAAIASKDISALERAVRLYTGPLLEGCGEDWVFQERAVREQSCLHALQTLGDAALADGEFGKAVDFYQRAVSIDPWWEAARRGWMEALARSGDTNEALVVYRKFVEVLKADPKAVPDEQTSALYQRLRSETRERVGTHAVVSARGAREVDGPHGPATLPATAVQGYLPHPLTELVGREDERAEVSRQLRRSRVVTLTGMGGIGKTRLAREVASEVVREYPDGVWLVALEALSEDSLVVQQVASVLGLTEKRDRTVFEDVTDHLCRKRLLLVLDNCEHLLEASAHLVTHLLQQCGNVRILATSREPLGITGETVWAVPCLAVPDTEHLPTGQATLLRVLTGYESVLLFVERAQAVQKTFALTGRNARAVAETCRRLEGIPLAIELAATRVKAMTVEQIASRLEDRLSLLTTGSRTAQSRHQTLRATLDWSYELLTEKERALLRRLSVFSGGWSLESAEQICSEDAGETDWQWKMHDGRRTKENPEVHTQYPKSEIQNEEVLDLLTSLADKSLVVFEERGHALGRYRLLEMVRQYAAEGLRASGETERARARHRDWFLALAEESEPRLKGIEQGEWLGRLETESDNLRAALAFCGTDARGGEAGLRLAGALYRYWYVRGDYIEGRAHLGRALEHVGALQATPLRAKALNAAGDLACHQGDLEVGMALNEQGLSIQRQSADKGGLVISLNNLGDMAYSRGDHQAAKALYEESLALSRELGDKHSISHTLHFLGNVAYTRGDKTTARGLFEESLALSRELGDKAGIANGLNALAASAHSAREFASARTLIEDALAIRRELSDKSGIALSLTSLGRVAHSMGDNDTARSVIEEALTIRREMADKVGIAMALYCLGTVYHSQGDFEGVRTVMPESLALFRQTGHHYIVHAVGILGHAARDAADYPQAEGFYQESLLLRQEHGDAYAIAQSLEDFAGLAARQAQWERAARLLGAADALCESIGCTLPIAMPAEYELTVASAGAKMGDAAFAAARDLGRTFTREQAVDFALNNSQVES